MISSPSRLALSHQVAARTATNKVSRSTKTAFRTSSPARTIGGSRAQPSWPKPAQRPGRRPPSMPTACAGHLNALGFPTGKPLGNTLGRKQTVTAGGRTLRYNNPRTRARDLVAHARADLKTSAQAPKRRAQRKGLSWLSVTSASSQHSTAHPPSERSWSAPSPWRRKSMQSSRSVTSSTLCPMRPRASTSSFCATRARSASRPTLPTCWRRPATTPTSPPCS